MIYVVLITSVFAVIFFLKYIWLRREVKILSQQLQRGHVEKNYQKVYYSSKNESIEQLASQINDLIQHKRDIQASEIRKENSLKEEIASMSHDLRTPLTATIGYLQLLDKENLSHKQQEYLNAANQRAQHLEKLINNFFALSVVEAGDNSLSLKEINLVELVQEVAFAFYDNFQDLSIEPQFKMTSESVIIMADEAASYRVIENIVLNALQHSTLHDLRDKANFELELVTEENWAILSVTNTFANGSVDVEKVFQRFYTSDVSRKNKGGLGLTIVKRLMEKMDGEVDVFIKNDLFTVVCRFKLM
ncbi:MAG TPA: HAMP domain-containing sensor histidine kinase [Bacillota bacterium]|nr:HAMP domain-containing sensor histidine kinase [Bacillota bacterium]